MPLWWCVRGLYVCLFIYVLVVLGYPLSTAQNATLMGFEPTTSTVTGWRALRCSTGPCFIYFYVLRIRPDASFHLPLLR